MPRFKINQLDPLEHKEQILRFWEECLPGTSDVRLEWMQNNPAGESIWLFAFDSSNNELAGMISIMLHEIAVQGEVILSGIVGDFMISNKYRVFGPAMSLMRKTTELMSELNIAFLYTVPNSASIKLAASAGFLEKIQLCNMVRPIKSELYMTNHIKNSFIRRVLSIGVDQVLKRLPVGVSLSKKDNFEMVSEVDQSFDDLWKKIKFDSEGFIGGHGSSYLVWRYCQNPQIDFQCLKYSCERTGELYGFIVYFVYDNKILIYDFLAQSIKHRDKLMKKLLKDADNDGRQAICITVSDKSTLFFALKKFMFFDTKDDASVLVHEGVKNLEYEDWCFLAGDRNI